MSLVPVNYPFFDQKSSYLVFLVVLKVSKIMHSKLMVALYMKKLHWSVLFDKRDKLGAFERVICDKLHNNM